MLDKPHQFVATYYQQLESEEENFNNAKNEVDKMARMQRLEIPGAYSHTVECIDEILNPDG